MYLLIKYRHTHTLHISPCIQIIFPLFSRFFGHDCRQRPSKVFLEHFLSYLQRSNRTTVVLPSSSRVYYVPPSPKFTHFMHALQQRSTQKPGGYVVGTHPKLESTR